MKTFSLADDLLPSDLHLLLVVSGIALGLAAISTVVSQLYRRIFK
jgi:hypothetical protein